MKIYRFALFFRDIFEADASLQARGVGGEGLGKGRAEGSTITVF